MARAGEVLDVMEIFVGHLVAHLLHQISLPVRGKMFPDYRSFKLAGRANTKLAKPAPFSVKLVNFRKRVGVCLLVDLAPGGGELLVTIIAARAL